LKKSFGRTLIAPGLHQDIDEEVAVLIDSPPEVLQFAVDFQEKLIDVVLFKNSILFDILVVGLPRYTMRRCERP
jgi:hypothetical protein